MKANYGDRVKVITKKEVYEGILMPHPALLGEKTLVVKLDSGYNVGIDNKNVKKIEVLKKHSVEKRLAKEKIKVDKKKKTILVLHTGGTIASKVDYKTGGVVADFSPEELLKMFPELKDIVNIKAKLVFQMFSEDMEPGHWGILASEIKKNLKKYDGFIITHGTDTLHYTSAALSFMLKGIDKPVLLVGAQRSSDRGSSDAALNVLCAAQFIAKSKFCGVGLCLHGTTEDDYCYVHSGVKVRKLHSSRRDAFESVNAEPIAKVYTDGKIELLNKCSSRVKFEFKNKFKKKVAIVKARPGFHHSELEAYSGFKGLVIEGTGLGHIAVNDIDNLTKEHKKILDVIKKLAKKMPVVMCTQCIFGRVNMNVYSTGRYLLDAGVISGEDMTSETAFVKLGWLLGNFDKKKVRELFSKNLVGEIYQRL